MLLRQHAVEGIDDGMEGVTLFRTPVEYGPERRLLSACGPILQNDGDELSRTGLLGLFS